MLLTCGCVAFIIYVFSGPDVFIIVKSVVGKLLVGVVTGPSGCGRMKGNGCPRRGSDGSDVGSVILSYLLLSEIRAVFATLLNASGWILLDGSDSDVSSLLSLATAPIGFDSDALCGAIMVDQNFFR